jgi:FkbM family methyltransferase
VGPAPAFLGSPELGRVLAGLGLTALDVGARRGFTADLEPLAFAVDAVGFEPDLEECARLNRGATPSPWRSLRYLPVALGRDGGPRPLHLYSNPECSSLLEADAALAGRYGRAHYFQPAGVVDVATVPLDVAAATHGLERTAFVKADVQGAELEVFQSGARLLAESVLAVRTEVELVPLYRGQPLWADVDRYLRSLGFMPMGFVEMREWRHAVAGRPPGGRDARYSRGQLVHADVLYLRDPDAASAPEPEALVRLAALAMAYEYVDFGIDLLRRPRVSDYLATTWGVDVAAATDVVAATVDRAHRRASRRRLWTTFKGMCLVPLRAAGRAR